MVLTLYFYSSYNSASLLPTEHGPLPKNDRRLKGTQPRPKVPDPLGRSVRRDPDDGQKRDSGTNDRIRSYLFGNHLQIRIEDTPPFYDMSIFNHCAETGNVLLTLECWTEIHPILSYGLLYSLNPTGDVRRFVESVEKYVL